MKHGTILLLLFLLSLSQAQMAKQNPSPMTEKTRLHQRVAQVDLTDGKVFEEQLFNRVVKFYAPANNNVIAELNLLIHFHGAQYIPITAVSNLTDNFVVVALHLGAGSSIYEKYLARETDFELFLSSLKEIIQNYYKQPIVFGQVYLSSFSAGYGALRAILRNETSHAIIDGVLILDGLHTGYIPDGKPLAGGGQLDEEKLRPFLKFAELAALQNKKFVLTHSEIFPGTYASTTETSDWLTGALGLKRSPILNWGPVGMQQLSKVREGNLIILGFAGNTAPDHIDHYHGYEYFFNILYCLE